MRKLVSATLGKVAHLFPEVDGVECGGTGTSVLDLGTIQILPTRLEHCRSGRNTDTMQNQLATHRLTILPSSPSSRLWWIISSLCFTSRTP